MSLFHFIIFIYSVFLYNIKLFVVVDVDVFFPVLRSIIVYKSSQRSKKVRLQQFFTPDKSTVTSLVYKRPCLYAGLVGGSVVVYSRSQGVCVCVCVIITWEKSSVDLVHYL